MQTHTVRLSPLCSLSHADVEELIIHFYVLAEDINYNEFAKRLWGDIYFNPKT